MSGKIMSTKKKSPIKASDLAEMNNLLTLGMGKDDEQVLQKARSLIVTLQQNAQMLTKKDISAWRSAHQMALNPENPKRLELYNIYDFTTSLDTHIEGVWLRIKSELKQKKFAMRNTETKKENEPMTDLLESIWFKEFLELIIETKFYGYSLIEFGNVIKIGGKMGFEKIELVPRGHVCPGYHVLLKDQGDEPKKGFDYTKGSLADWSVAIGKPKDFGAFLKASPKAISKKHVEIFWDNFAEKFGIPILYANTDSKNENDRKKVTNMLQNMGNSAWGLFPGGTELKMIQTNRGDAYQVFDQRLERCDQQISKCLAGQTMVFDDGSSRSQGETHLKGFQKIMDAYADDARDIINNTLLPFLLKHGFPVDGHRFDWDESYDFSPEEINEKENILLQHYDIPGEYFTQRYNIPILGKKQVVVFDPEDKDPEKKKSGSNENLNFPTYDADTDETPLLKLTKSSAGQQIGTGTKLIRQVWDDKETSFCWDLFHKISELLFDSLCRGIQGKKRLKLSDGKEVVSIYDHRNQAAITAMEANIFHFSAAKTQAEVIELNRLAREAKNFNEFNAQAQKLLSDYNGRYLQTEYSNAYQVGTMSAKYWDMKAASHIYPTWIYTTMGDGKVREEHSVLHGMRLPSNDPVWQTIFPPNGWRCRCTVVPDSNDPPEDASGEQALEKLAQVQVSKTDSALDRMRKQGFAVNCAETEVAFTESQMYIKQFKFGNFSVREMYGTKDMNWTKIDKESLPERRVTIDSKEKALLWFEQQKNAENRVVFKDYAGRNLRLNTESFTNHLDESIEKYKNRHTLVNYIPEILNNPDEVWFDRDEKLFMYKYLKMFKHEMVMVVTNPKNGKILSWYDVQNDSNRKGILIKRMK